MRQEFTFNKSCYVVDEVDMNQTSVSTKLKWARYENDYFFDIGTGHKIKIYVRSLDDKQEFYIESTIILENFDERANSQVNNHSKWKKHYECGEENVQIAMIERESTYNARTIFRTFPRDSENTEDKAIRFVVSRLPFSKIPIACFHKNGCVPDLRLPEIVGFDEDLGIYFLLTEETEDGGHSSHTFKQVDTIDYDNVTSRHLLYVAKSNYMKIEVKNLQFESTEIKVKNHQTCDFGSADEVTILSAREMKTIARLCGGDNLNSIRVFLPNNRVESFRVYNVDNLNGFDDSVRDQKTVVAEKTNYFRWDQIGL
jgi:hypothetical protein